MKSARSCGACGAPAAPPHRAPPPELAPDLDLRPGEPARSTLPDWLRVCPGCGAVAPDLSALPDGAAETVASEGYRAIAADRPFERWALICAASGDRRSAAEATLQAAWAADDRGDAGGAIGLRIAAAESWGDPEDERSSLRLIDVLRRAQKFAEAEIWARRVAASWADENTVRIAQYQLSLIAAGDSGRHMLSSALRPPARTPHVAHGRTPAKPGFWGRLRGK